MDPNQYHPLVSVMMILIRKLDWIENFWKWRGCKIHSTSQKEKFGNFFGNIVILIMKNFNCKLYMKFSHLHFSKRLCLYCLILSVAKKSIRDSYSHHTFVHVMLVSTIIRKLLKIKKKSRNKNDY